MPRSANVCPRNRVRYNGYPEIADIFHRMTVELAIGRPDFACAETFGSYAVARLQGMEPSEAEKGILGIYRALGR